MKRILAILSLLYIVFLSISCNSDVIDGEKTPYYVDYHDHTPLRVVEIEGCEYLIFSNEHKFAITHKGNCKYCMTRKCE